MFKLKMNFIQFRACQNGYIEQVECLIGAGAKCTVHKITKCTPLYAAIKFGNTPIVRKLLAHFPETINVIISFAFAPYPKLKLKLNAFSVSLFKGYDIRKLVSTSRGLYKWQK